MLGLREQTGGALMSRRLVHFYQRIIVMEAIASLTVADPVSNLEQF
jgi:hypothetical protein